MQYNLSLRAIKCCSVVFGITLKLLVINISLSFPAINNHRHLHWQQSVTTCSTVVRRRRIDNTSQVPGFKSTHWSQISRFLPTPPAFDAPIRGGGFPFDIAMPFGTEKLEWCGYPTVKKFDAMFIRFDRTHESDRQTPHEDIGRTCIASRGKN